MFTIWALSGLLIAAVGAASTDTSYKDQFCTDPRTMQKHAAYSEWPDSYSCTRHRCQPGGRNLAIYTVGCKRVEAPEAAIECEEVVEDTNMQFPYCCTRLRCLVVVRGEVWTRVLGQPWEALSAAPWSHMYKMKKPPPADSTFVPKNIDQGPVYELQTDIGNEHDKVLRSSKKSSSPVADCNEPATRSVPSPDIVIALTTQNDEKMGKIGNSRNKLHNAPSVDVNDADREADKERIDVEIDDAPADEKSTWSEIPQSQWNVHDPSMDEESLRAPTEKHDKPALQALVDAIGNRMRDIENVVQSMSEKVQHNKEPDTGPGDKRLSANNRVSKYLRASGDVTSEPALLQDSDLNGYFSDASNSVVRRSGSPKEPAIATYVAPVENRPKSQAEILEEVPKKHKNHSHNKKRKNKGHKKHHIKKEKRKRFNTLMSSELDKNIVSLEDSDAGNI